MSTTATVVTTNARGILGDPDTGRSVFSPEDFRIAYNRHAQIIAADLGLGSAWLSAAVTLVPGTVDYTLPGTSEYAQVLDVIYSSDRVHLPVRSYDEIAQRRAGSIGRGRPGMCCLRPTSVQTVVLMTDTDPVAGETLDLLTSMVPASWLAGDATPPTLYFSQKAASALELRMAASLAATAGPEKRNQLALDRDDAKVWNAEAGELVRQEQLAIYRMKLSRGPTASAWFFAWSRHGG